MTGLTYAGLGQLPPWLVPTRCPTDSLDWFKSPLYSCCTLSNSESLLAVSREVKTTPVNSLPSGLCCVIHKYYDNKVKENDKNAVVSVVLSACWSGAYPSMVQGLPLPQYAKTMTNTMTTKSKTKIQRSSTGYFISRGLP